MYYYTGCCWHEWSTKVSFICSTFEGRSGRFTVTGGSLGRCCCLLIHVCSCCPGAELSGRLHLHTSLAFREPWVILGHTSTQDPNPFKELSRIQIKKYERDFCIWDASVKPAELWKSQCDERRQLFVSLLHLLLSLPSTTLLSLLYSRHKPPSFSDYFSCSLYNQNCETRFFALGFLSFRPGGRACGPVYDLWDNWSLTGRRSSRGRKHTQTGTEQSLTHTGP